MRVDLAKQFGFAEWFADEVISADLHQLLAVFVHRTCGDGDDLRLFAAGHRADPADRFLSIHDRHAKVHQDQMRLPLLESLHRLRTVIGQPNLESDRSQKLSQQLAVVIDIVGDQTRQAGWPACSRRTCRGMSRD